jgi:CTP:molybdopterin cytidylyltransferase MocA
MLNISAIILAAGSGKRIGTPKLKLKIGEDYFVNLIIKTLKAAGIDKIDCVIRAEDTNWFGANALPVELIINRNTDSGMIHSVMLGINQLKESDGALIFPVDHPLVRTDTVKCLTNTFEEYNTSIIKPFINDLSGHPVLIPSKLYEAVIQNNAENNLNYIINESNLPIKMVEVQDTGITKNINSISDLENLK